MDNNILIKFQRTEETLSGRFYRMWILLFPEVFHTAFCMLRFSISKLFANALPTILNFTSIFGISCFIRENSWTKRHYMLENFRYTAEYMDCWGNIFPIKLMLYFGLGEKHSFLYSSMDFFCFFSFFFLQFELNHKSIFWNQPNLCRNQNQF